MVKISSTFHWNRIPHFWLTWFKVFRKWKHLADNFSIASLTWESCGLQTINCSASQQSFSEGRSFICNNNFRTMIVKFNNIVRICRGSKLRPTCFHPPASLCWRNITTETAAVPMDDWINSQTSSPENSKGHHIEIFLNFHNYGIMNKIWWR